MLCLAHITKSRRALPGPAYGLDNARLCFETHVQATWERAHAGLVLPNGKFGDIGGLPFPSMSLTSFVTSDLARLPNDQFGRHDQRRRALAGIAYFVQEQPSERSPDLLHRLPHACQLGVGQPGRV